MEELKIKKIQDKEKVDAVCQGKKSNCSTKKEKYGYYLGCDEECPNVPHNKAYKDTRW